MRNVIWRQSKNFQWVTWRFSNPSHNERPRRQINKNGVAAMAIDREDMDKEAAKYGKYKIMCQMGLIGLHSSYVTFVHLWLSFQPFQSLGLSLPWVWHLSNFPCAYTLFRIISIARYVFKSKLHCIECWKPQACIMGPHRQSTRRWKDLWSNCPQAFFCFFLRCFLLIFFMRHVLHCTPTNWTPGRS